MCLWSFSSKYPTDHLLHHFKKAYFEWKQKRAVLVHVSLNANELPFPEQSCDITLIRVSGGDFVKHKQHWEREGQKMRYSLVTYASRDLGTRDLATLRFPGEHVPFSSPRDMPIRFRISTSSWISNVLSKLKRYSHLCRVKDTIITVGA